METRIIRPLTDDEHVNAMMGDFMTPSHYKEVINRDFVGYKSEDGTVGVMLVKDCIRRYTWESAQEFLRTVHGDPRNRGTAVAGKGSMMNRLRQDGTLSNRIAVPASVMKLVGGTANNLGYFDYLDEADKRKLSCRETNWTLEHPEVFAGAYPYILEIATLFQACLPEECARQMSEVQKVSAAFKISNTPFTTLTCNKNLRTALHTDQGDLKCGKGVMATLGRFRGGISCFPNTALRLTISPAIYSSRTCTKPTATALVGARDFARFFIAADGCMSAPPLGAASFSRNGATYI